MGMFGIAVELILSTFLLSRPIFQKIIYIQKNKYCHGLHFPVVTVMPLGGSGPPIGKLRG